MKLESNKVSLFFKNFFKKMEQAPEAYKIAVSLVFSICIIVAVIILLGLINLLVKQGFG